MAKLKALEAKSAQEKYAILMERVGEWLSCEVKVERKISEFVERLQAGLLMYTTFQTLAAISMVTSRMLEIAQTFEDDKERMAVYRAVLIFLTKVDKPSVQAEVRNN